MGGNTAVQAGALLDGETADLEIAQQISGAAHIGLAAHGHVALDLAAEDEVFAFHIAHDHAALVHGHKAVAHGVAPDAGAAQLHLRRHHIAENIAPHGELAVALYVAFDGAGKEHIVPAAEGAVDGDVLVDDGGRDLAYGNGHTGIHITGFHLRDGVRIGLGRGLRGALRGGLFLPDGLVAHQFVQGAHKRAFLFHVGTLLVLWRFSWSFI